MSPDRDPSGDLFERMYATAGGDARRIPWARSAPHPAVAALLASVPPPPGGRALVVGCGLGDDAEAAADGGWRVTAFDLSPTAVDWCRRRFPTSPVDYRVADLLDAPPEWGRAFGLVIEVRTLQSLPPSAVRAAVAAIAGTVAPGGTLLVGARMRAGGPPPSGPPWPLVQADLDAFTHHGLVREQAAHPVAHAGRGADTVAAFGRPA